MKTPNPDHPIRNTLKHLALASTMGAALYFGATPANAAPPVTTGLNLHLDASQLGLNDNDPVPTWTDMSGAGNDATTIRGIPYYKAAGIGGPPTVHFDDGDGLGNGVDYSGVPVTVFYVSRQTGGTNQRVLAAQSNNWLLGYWGGSKGSAYFEGDVLLYGNGTSDTAPHLYATTIGGSGQDSTVWAEGIQIASNQNGTQGPNGLALGGGGAYDEFSDCDISEVLVYNRILNLSELNLVGGYLTYKYGLTTTYPPPGPPAAPTGLVATPLRQAIRLDWTAPASYGVTGYKVDRLTGTGGTIDATYDASGLTYTDTTVTTGGPYYYVVRAVNSAGAGAPSNEASASPSAVPVDQTITFALGLAVTKTAADAPFADTASAFPSGLPVAYSVPLAEQSVATVDASTGEVALTGVPGTAHILADQAGNDDFNAATQVSQTLTVNQAMPVITWVPAPIVVGSSLSGTQLNATSGGVDGTFVYDPPSGTPMLVVGLQSLSVQFTPTDTTKYSIPALTTVEILVVPVESTVIWNTGDGTWNTTAANWKGNDSGSPTFFTQGNDVIFNSTAGGTITIAPDMAPASTTVNAESGTYSFSDGPLAGTGTLTKSGDGNLSLNGTHTYTGGTVINGGRLNVGTDAIPGTGPITINSGVFGDTTATALQVNGGTLTNAIIWDRGNVDIRWTGSIWNGPVTLNAPVAFFRNPYCGTINGTISGTGLLHTAQANLGPNNGLTLTGNNTYSGGTINDNGSLILGHPNALGTGPVSLTTAWPWNPVSITAAVDLSGGTGVQNNIDLQTDGTIYANNNIQLSGVISGTGNLTKAGNSSLVLTGTNTYTGATIVTGGTLQCDNPNALGGGALSISTGGAKVNLNYTGTKGVASLTLGGVAKTDNGTYGSVLSGATFQDDTYFDGTGMVRVGGSSPYDAWANGTFANGATLSDKDPTHDPDGDGQTNQQEFAFGLDPTTGASVNPISQQLAGGVFKYTRTKDSGLTYKVYYSTNLTGWTWDEFASQTPAAAVLGVETVTVTLAAAAPLDGKLFVRVEASP